MAAVVRQEVPCRDTDPLTGEDDELDSNRDSPVAFTINFGFGEDIESAKEKAKKLERFALRSSLRKTKSPRHSPSEKSAVTSTENTEKSSIEIMRKNSAMGSGYKRAPAGGLGRGFTPPASGRLVCFVR